MALEMVSELINPHGQKRDLDVRASSIFVVQLKRTQIKIVTRYHNFQGGLNFRGERRLCKQKKCR